MRVPCMTSVVDRNHPEHKTRTLKSVISIGYRQRTGENSEMFLLHQNQLQKSGQKYKIKLNVMKVFTKFIHEGKATISFKEPPHDLLIQCDKIQLMALMSTFRMGLSGDPNFSKFQLAESNSNSRKLKLPQLVETKFSIKNRVDRIMSIKNRSDLDKGIPRTVENLTVCTYSNFIINLTN